LYEEVAVIDEAVVKFLLYEEVAVIDEAVVKSKTSQISIQIEDQNPLRQGRVEGCIRTELGSVSFRN